MEIPTCVQKVFDVNLGHRSYGGRGEYYPTYSPINFFDKHLDTNSIMKSVVHLPDLQLELLNFIDELVESADEFPSAPFPSKVYDGGFFLSRTCQSIQSATDIARNYELSLSKSCAYVASRILLQSKSNGWFNDLVWKKHSENDNLPSSSHGAGNYSSSSPKSDSWFTTRKWSLFLQRNAPQLGVCLALTTAERNRWKFLKECSPDTELAVWEIFACSSVSRELFSSIQDIAKQAQNSDAVWKRPCTEDFHLTHHPYKFYPDATETPWTLPESTTNSDVYESTHPTVTTVPPLIHTKPLQNNRAEYPTSTVERGMDYLQRAWARAVDINATFIILHRGASEIICIRHRASQTLYVSGIIDTSAVGYGKLQAALYAAIVKDKAIREEMWATRDRGDKGIKGKEVAEKELEEKEKKRGAADDNDSGLKNNGRPMKRSRSNSDGSARPSLVSHISDMKTRCQKLNLAIISLEYSLHRSAAPSLFIRCIQTSEGEVLPSEIERSYPLSHCLRLDIREKIGHGASGIVHRATLFIGAGSGNTPNTQHLSQPPPPSEDVVVKFARHRTSRESLQHEFLIYSRLAQEKVHAVPYCFGLFEDIESEDSPLILVTSYVGENLAVVHQNRYFYDLDETKRKTVLVPHEQRPAFLHSLAELHAAGVHHRDIRPPNIVIDKEGNVKFIDFDKARLYVTGKERKHERKRLLGLMRGRAVDYDRTSMRSGRSCGDCTDGSCSDTMEGGEDEEEEFRAQSEPPLRSRM
ncbi:hypothetical protein BDP27DRAFT_1418451 [Rhodocollybia butyracea]|uniref:Protein kinase domain-containing protein n=1 Tax=Rhodocollybia butyracea TaxID=206335 RepID=A0A9P5PTK6_9AGAR|nr:hypothetical protein BDP27DRAFT_1418451 [Rhodocollybia butyracea]